MHWHGRGCGADAVVNTPPEVDTIKTDVVEINGAVVPLAEKYFDFNASKVNLTIGDGRQFINATPHRYDAIVLDAFLGDSSPSHLMTREAFLEMREHLTEQGVLVINTFGDPPPKRQFLPRRYTKHCRLHLAKSACECMPRVWVTCFCGHAR